MGKRLLLRQSMTRSVLRRRWGNFSSRSIVLMPTMVRLPERTTFIVAAPCRLTIARLAARSRRLAVRSMRILSTEYGKRRSPHRGAVFRYGSMATSVLETCSLIIGGSPWSSTLAVWELAIRLAICRSRGHFLMRPVAKRFANRYRSTMLPGLARVAGHCGRPLSYRPNYPGQIAPRRSARYARLAKLSPITKLRRAE